MIAIVAVALVLAVAARGSAHEHGVLRLVSKTFRAGDSLTIDGAKFTRNDEVTLVLVGVAGRVPLGAAPTDSAGKFSRKFLVPASMREGQYRLVAEAIDGDEVASVQVVVQAASAAAPMKAMPTGAGHEGMEMEPTGEPLTLTRATSSAVRGMAILLIIACVAAGAILLRTPHAHSRENGQ
jgi:hypothetical protein